MTTQEYPSVGSRVYLEGKELIVLSVDVELGIIHVKDNENYTFFCLIREVQNEPPSGETPRSQILAEADRLVHSDRNKSYGEPTGNFENTAALWNTQFSHKLKEPFTATDVALALIQLKLARIISSPKRDNWADILGYAACGFECDVSSGAITDD